MKWLESDESSITSTIPMEELTARRQADLDLSCIFCAQSIKNKVFLDDRDVNFVPSLQVH